MLACRRISTIAARSWARQCCGANASISWCSAGPVRCLSSLPDHQVVGMPALSPTMTHGNLGTWSKQEGEEILAGDVVCEVETDKATVDFDAQDDSFMAKHLVAAGTQDIAVGTPIFVTVEDVDSVAAFKNFKPAEEAAAPAGEGKQPEVAKAAPPSEAAPETTSPEPVAAKKEEAPAPAPSRAAAAAAPATEMPKETPRAAETKSGLVFKRDWGSGVRGSPLAHRMSAQQKKYVEQFGSTLQQPFDS